jgi:PAS domain S-box-containing protein
MDLKPPHARAAGLHEVLTTQQLEQRSSRPPEHEAENRALQTLAQELATRPRNLLQKLVETVLEVCRADSAGISIHVPDEGVGSFRWDAVAGRFAHNIGGSMPRDQSPCGTVIDSDSVLLFDQPHRHFTALAGVEPPIVENLLVPFHVEGRPVGTLWAIGHTPERRFDAEDARLLSSLSRFASAGYQLVKALDETAAARDKLEERVQERTRELTERKRAEEALRQSQAETERLKRLYETILSSTPDLVYVFGLDYRFTFANDALLQMWGRTLEDSVGKSLLEIGYEPWHAEMHEREIDQVIATKQPIRGEVAFPHATLGRRIYDYIFVPVLGAEGEVEAIAGTTRDVTERKRTEEELREAKQLAEAASQAKSQFLAVMSHELRTPLSGVIGFADLMETEVLGPTAARQKEALSRIKASSWHLVAIIDEILTLSRVEAGKERAQYEETDIARITRDVAGILEPQAEVHGLALRLQGTESPLPVWTDPGKVRQILINLVGNAVKYTEQGEVKVHLDRSDPEWLRVHVRDTGPGIAPEDQERIFEAFTQVDSSHTRGGNGTGLGLAIARKMARLLGGDVMLQSTPGAGSTFTLRLPREKPQVS